MGERPHYNLSLSETAQRFGALRALQALVLRLLKVRPVVLLAWNAGTARPSVAEDPRIRPVTQADAHLFERAGFPGALERKLADGPGWLMLDQDRLVAWSFLGLAESEIDGWLVIQTGRPTALWGAGSWVHRDYRGSGLASKVRSHSVKWYLEQGYREQFSWINLVNHSSLRSWRKQGAREIGRITCFRWFGLALVHDGRRWHLGRWSADRPLVLSMENIRRDRDDAPRDHATATSTSALRAEADAVRHR